MIKRIVLIVAVLVIAVVVYVNREVLQQQADRSYRAARGLITGEDIENETDGEEAGETSGSEGADKSKAAATRPAPKESSPGGNAADQNAGPSGPLPPDADAAAGAVSNPSTGVMIVASGSSVGGIRSTDIFGDARVYTTYIDMDYGAGQISEWTMQYALLSTAGPSATSAAQPRRTLRSVQMEPAVRAPIPIQKESPQFSPELVARNPGAVVVVYAVINTAGKMEQVRILPGSEQPLNAPILEALQKWSFQPAQVNSSPVAVKSLIGVVLPNAL